MGGMRYDTHGSKAELGILPPPLYILGVSRFDVTIDGSTVFMSCGYNQKIAQVCPA